MASQITVVGMGAEGWDGLAPPGRDAVLGAQVLLGGRRHLAMLPATGATRESWPTPLRDGLAALLDRHRGQRIVVVASGDPLVSGIGSTLVAHLGVGAVTVLPAVSSVALARARMGWSAESVDVVTLVGRDVNAARRAFGRGRRLIVLTSDGRTPARIADLLCLDGFGASTMTVLSNLGAPGEARHTVSAASWSGDAPSLNVVCIECNGAEGYSTAPGLPDDAFEHDGQLSKRPIRLAAVCALAPRPGQLLWDVGAGAGSVGIEWARVDPRCRTVAIERDGVRADRIARNAARLGVPSVTVVRGSAPEALAGLATPDAIFVGGGTVSGVLETCWEVLRPSGRLVVHAVTFETEATLVRWWKTYGGELTRLTVEQAAPLGGFSGWQALRPVVQWSVTRGES
ncbi:precorrin-6y C5,15-methyltransferase (decarboxylating) subunit CbiE [Rhodococcus opacus]|uniref:Cobalamin biosynthesis bifunctional protein CbiET n=1 Tax=Rhodococcus opacus TaxID=37919 RepID=A0A2S8J9C6_RHOOP|nr:precorrin-6y C5,15-methyltransferase (decarboxylating) subunit CbiE [Rhodococcus opacus]PQP23563.1 cobalamin biosynthesis bifunctional protein CbiET [Rhodococcus opacus]